MIPLLGVLCLSLFILCSGLAVMLLAVASLSGTSIASVAAIAAAVVLLGILFLVVGLAAHAARTTDQLFGRLRSLLPMVRPVSNCRPEAQGGRESQEAGDQNPCRLIFLSYSHCDDEWMKRFKTHLTPLLRGGTYALWTDRGIECGDRWEAELLAAIKQSRIAISLVSADYLASEFVYQREIPAMLDGVPEQRKLTWIHVRPASWQFSVFKDLQAAHDPNKPLANLRDPAQQDDALVKIVNRMFG